VSPPTNWVILNNSTQGDGGDDDPGPGNQFTLGELLVMLISTIGFFCTVVALMAH
jgi:hypothetical protein